MNSPNTTGKDPIPNVPEIIVKEVAGPLFNISSEFSKDVFELVDGQEQRLLVVDASVGALEPYEALPERDRLEHYEELNDTNFLYWKIPDGTRPLIHLIPGKSIEDNEQLSIQGIVKRGAEIIAELYAEGLDVASVAEFSLTRSLVYIPSENRVAITPPFTKADSGTELLVQYSKEILELGVGSYGLDHS